MGGAQGGMESSPATSGRKVCADVGDCNGFAALPRACTTNFFSRGAVVLGPSTLFYVARAESAFTPHGCARTHNDGT